MTSHARHLQTHGDSLTVMPQYCSVSLAIAQQRNLETDISTTYHETGHHCAEHDLLLPEAFAAAFVEYHIPCLSDCLLMGHDHGTENLGDGRLLIAVSVNELLTLVEIIGDIPSGSLSLIDDALHNLSDVASFGIALVARKIGRKPADEHKTFGYKRAEVIAALINLNLVTR
ncbi:cation diffusion facilitator family transporter [Nitrosomonas marina]|uniref:Cation diffusion facilitator family transporter n=1 Tax=Nitrosomonas marina TaxID=917 RepID=A0A1H8GU62_9PROT|nr:cation diffusion facilitator family transporter [Nitrosomonas marina]SEN46798.1 cation diffusion facilitator family transporter [Nitrosomonas marina]